MVHGSIGHKDDYSISQIPQFGSNNVNFLRFVDQMLDKLKIIAYIRTINKNINYYNYDSTKLFLRGKHCCLL